MNSSESLRSRRLGRSIRGKAIGIIAAGCLVSTLAIPGIAAASTTNQAKSLVQQGLDFYKGKTITFVSDGSAGDSFYLEAVALQPALSAYLHATVNIEPIAGGNTFPAQDTVEAANPDGLTIGILNALSDAANEITNTPGLNFNPERVAFLAGTGPSINTLIAAKSSGITTFAQLMKEKSPVKVLVETAGQSTTVARVTLGVLGAPVTFVTGFGTTSALVQGYASGDGPLAYNGVSEWSTFLSSGQGVGLFNQAAPVKGSENYAQLHSAPSIPQLLTKYPAKTAQKKKQYSALLGLVADTGFDYFTGTKVAADKVAALRSAFEYAFKNKGVYDNIIAGGNNPLYLSPAQTKQYYITAINDGPLVKQFISQ